MGSDSSYAVLYLLWVVVIKILNATLSLLNVDRVAAVHAELGKLQLLAAKLGEGTAAPRPGRVAHF